MTTVDKTAWGPGPWQDEPDRIEFDALGFPCLMRRVPELGSWCGYVAVPPGHPLHGADGNDLDVHWGVTYAGACHGEICHVPKPGEPDNMWWFGFDCAHCDDYAPGMQACSGLAAALLEAVRWLGRLDGGAEYRTADYVRTECIRLAAQLATAWGDAPTPPPQNETTP